MTRGVGKGSRWCTLVGAYELVNEVAVSPVSCVPGGEALPGFAGLVLLTGERLFAAVSFLHRTFWVQEDLGDASGCKAYVFLNLGCCFWL